MHAEVVLLQEDAYLAPLRRAPVRVLVLPPLAPRPAAAEALYVGICRYLSLLLSLSLSLPLSPSLSLSL